MQNIDDQNKNLNNNLLDDEEKDDSIYPVFDFYSNCDENKDGKISDKDSDSLENIEDISDNDFQDKEEHSDKKLEIDNENYDCNNKKEHKIDDEKIVVNKSKIVLAKFLVENIKENNEKLIQIFSDLVKEDNEIKIGIGQIDKILNNTNHEEVNSKTIEGVFDGENMIGSDGRQYSVSANYASKSKLVEGDMLKLTITGNGIFVYKQIRPIERVRVVGILSRNNNGLFIVKSNDCKWNVLLSSVTYFKGREGDEVILFVPKAGESKWGAVENIIRNKE